MMSCRHDVNVMSTEPLHSIVAFGGQLPAMKTPQRGRKRSTPAKLIAVALLVWPLCTSAIAAARSMRPITLEWVGDIALSSQLGLPPGGVAQGLAPVGGLLRKADVTLGNLEGTLSVGGTSKCGGIGGGNCFAFQAPPWIAGQLKALGFDLVNQANNHSLDYGPSGRRQTISALNRAGIAHTGLPGEVSVLHVGGTRVAFLGFAPYPYDANLLDIPAAERLVRRARGLARLVVVIIHAGAEGADRLHTPRGSEYYLGEDRGNARAFAHAMIDAGASIVLGSGPHVIRGVERYHHRLIAYSLGNFVGYRTLGGGGVLSQSAILRVTLGRGGRLLAGRWISIRLVEGLPRPDPTHASAKLVAALSRADFSSRFLIGPSGLFHLNPTTSRGRFPSGHVGPSAATLPAAAP
jgi:poly-gamma-glutamate capsule biosynthesis protein CapA/YwtB (metallophosphatase superfamily)